MDSDDSDNSDEVVAQLIINGTLPGFNGDESSDNEGISIRAHNKDRAFGEHDDRFDRMYFS